MCVLEQTFFFFLVKGYTKTFRTSRGRRWAKSQTKKHRDLCYSFFRAVTRGDSWLGICAWYVVADQIIHWVLLASLQNSTQASHFQSFLFEKFEHLCHVPTPDFLVLKNLSDFLSTKDEASSLSLFTIKGREKKVYNHPTDTPQSPVPTSPSAFRIDW